MSVYPENTLYQRTVPMLYQVTAEFRHCAITVEREQSLSDFETAQSSSRKTGMTRA